MEFKLFLFKLMTLILGCSLLCVESNGQHSDTTKPLTIEKNQLLSKGKWQKAVGWTMLGTGVPVALTSSILIAILPKDVWEEATGVKVLVISTVYSLAGLLILKAGIRNKKRALSLNLIENKIPVARFNRMSYKMQPGISLKVALN